MRIGIIGGGSVGLLFAGYLAETNDVTLYTRTMEQANLLKNNGVTIKNKNTSKTYRVHATTSNSSVKEEDILILAVKQYALMEVLLQAKDLDKVHTVCFLQNGMGHINFLKDLQNPNVLVGVVEHGALKMNEVTVLHTGFGQTKLGIFKGEHQGIVDAIDIQLKHFKFELHEDWYPILASKLIANAVINPLTALYGVKNGELLTNDYFYKQMKALFLDVTSVISTNKYQMWEQVVSICKNTADNKSSMLRDIEEGRMTEIDAILGYVLSEAEKHNEKLAITKFLYDSIKGMESRGR